jgi:two-component system, OmpR family, heavy metal sensor histidine kinase CusS
VDTVPVEMADLARELNHMLDRLQDDFRRLSEFSSDLAHELRTPISNLLTQTQVTLSHPRGAHDYRQALASNSEELQRLARTVSDMLFLAKAEHGLALPSLETIDLAHEATALLDFYDALAADRELTLRLDGQGSIQGDRLMVRRALSNLLTNAIRHAHTGTAVVVRVATQTQDVELSVDNQGTPLEADLLPRLFDRFYRADKARTHPSSDGAGLGLSITRAIVQAHGGRVGAESAGGHNRFWLRFPRRPDRAMPGPTEAI